MNEEQKLEFARKIVRKFYPEMPANYKGRRVGIVLETIRQLQA
jgi:hypothetical protein